MEARVVSASQVTSSPRPTLLSSPTAHCQNQSFHSAHMSLHILDKLALHKRLSFSVGKVVTGQEVSRDALLVDVDHANRTS